MRRPVVRAVVAGRGGRTHPLDSLRFGKWQVFTGSDAETPGNTYLGNQLPWRLADDFVSDGEVRVVGETGAGESVGPDDDPGLEVVPHPFASGVNLGTKPRRFEPALEGHGPPRWGQSSLSISGTQARHDAIIEVATVEENEAGTTTLPVHGVVQGDVRSPRVTDDDRTLGVGLFEYGIEVVTETGEVVAREGLIGKAVPAKIEGQHTDSSLEKSTGHPVPDAGIGGEAVEQNHCRGAVPPRAPHQTDGSGDEALRPGSQCSLRSVVTSAALVHDS